MLKVENVSKHYNDIAVLENINITFKNGIYGLLSPNGAGKTTLIKLLVTLATPTNGQIFYNEQSIVTMGEDYREEIGYLPQQFGFYKHQSPVQYLRYLAILKGMEKSIIDKRIDEVLEIVALSDVKHKKIRKFSGGMIQRVGIAQALLADPAILILDEPTAGLDPKERARFRNILTELALHHIIILSTHVVSDVETIANEIIMIQNQAILFQASPETICNKFKGKVYEKTLPISEYHAFRNQYITLAEKQENGMMFIRFYSEDEAERDWKLMTPQLEDVFLIVYADKEGV